MIIPMYICIYRQEFFCFSQVSRVSAGDEDAKQPSLAYASSCDDSMLMANEARDPNIKARLKIVNM